MQTKYQCNFCNVIDAQPALESLGEQSCGHCDYPQTIFLAQLLYALDSRPETTRIQIFRVITLHINRQN